MEQPTITAEAIAQFHALHGQFKTLQEQASAEIAAAQLNKDRDITITRDGKEVTVREKDLWDEVYHLGAHCDAGTILKEKYPPVFEASQKAEEKKAELKAFAITTWGIDPLAMTLSDIIKITEAVVDYKLANHQ